MVEVVMLGTGTPNPDPGRCGSGVAVVHDGRWVLVDCGRGVAQRAIDAGLDLAGIEAVALTHHHSDHVSDLATLAIARWVGGSVTPLVVVVPTGPCARFANRCLDAFEDQAFYSQVNAEAPLRPALTVSEFAGGEQPEVVFVSSTFSISAALVDHHPIEAAVGYRVEVDGSVIVVSGDTAVCAGIRYLARSADLLIHEALRSDRVTPKTLAWNASARSVGELAHELRLPKVVLTHLIPTPETSEDEDAYFDEARSSGYAGELLIASDLMRVSIR